jgi:hypothetical protein
MKRSNRKRHRPEEVVARLKRAHPRVSRDNAHLDSSPETSAFRGLRAVRNLSEPPRWLMSSCISGAGIVNQRPFGARGLSMRPIRKQRDNARARPRRSARHLATPLRWPTQIEAGRPPRAQSVLSSLGRKTPYARRKRERLLK